MLREHNRAVGLIPDKDTFKNSLATLPLVTYQPGETVIADGSRTGRLLILGKGTVAIVKEDTEIAKVAEPGAVFGELSVLLDQPHTADVRALETSQFYIADALRFSRKIRPRYFMLRRRWPTGSTARITLLFN